MENDPTAAPKAAPESGKAAKPSAAKKSAPNPPKVNLARVDLAGDQTPALPPSERAAEAAGVAVPKTPAEAEGFTAAEMIQLRGLLRGERIVAPALRQELKGHLGGQPVY